MINAGPGRVVSTKRRALLTNFSGLGNGLMVLPILASIERVAPWLSYYHVANPVFHEPGFMATAGLRRLLGEVPAIWRRFAPEDRPQIDRFVRDQQIDLVINLRNEDLAHDQRWSQFRADHQGVIECWDLAEVIEPGCPRHVVDEAIRLLELHGLDMSGCDPRFLVDRFPRQTDAESWTVGLAPGSTKAVKCWAGERWIALGRDLLADPRIRLEIYPGTSADDLARGREVATALGSLTARGTGARVQVREGLELAELARAFRSLSVLVANDSGPVHLATALDVPCVGLYFSTDARIWGGRNNGFVAIQSSYFSRCPERKPAAGNCRLYDHGCPAPCKDEVTPERVARAVRAALELDCIAARS